MSQRDGGRFGMRRVPFSGLHAPARIRTHQPAAEPASLWTSLGDQAGDGERWWAPRQPARARQLAAALLAAGAALVAAVVISLPDGEVPGVAYVVLAGLALHAALCVAVPASRPAGQLVVASSMAAAVVSLALMWSALYGQLTAGASMLAIPVVFAASQFRRPVVVLTVALVVCTAVLVVMANSARSLLAPLDVVMISFGVVVLAAFTTHHAEAQDELLRRLRDLAGIDPLTGLVTRRVLDEALASSLASAGARSGTALLLLDVDRFKSVNDVHGHPVGDAVLSHVAELLNAAVRDTDSVVSRLGGDELAVLLSGCPVDTAVRRGQQIVESVRSSPLVVEGGVTVELTVSVGVAHAPAHAVDVQSLYAAADQALYAAKRAGRDQVAAAPA